MSCFEWSEELETGYEIVDDQHKSLFALANRLSECAEAGDEAERVAGAVWELTDYVIEHFAAEEALMRLFEYPELGVHRTLHQHLTAETLSLASRYFNGEDVKADAIARFVAEWLQEHIREQDLRAISHVKAHKAE